MKGPLFLLVLSQLAHPLHVGGGGGTRGAVETQSGGTLLYHAIFSNAVVSTQLGCIRAFSAHVLYAPILIVCIVRRSVRLLLFKIYFIFSFQKEQYFSDREASPFLVDLFHFAVPIDALVVTTLFLALSERGRGLNDESPVLGDRVA